LRTFLVKKQTAAPCHIGIFAKNGRALARAIGAASR